MSPAFSLIWRTLQGTFTCGQKAVKEEFAASLLCMLQTFIHEKTTKVLVYVMIFYLKKQKKKKAFLLSNLSKASCQKFTFPGNGQYSHKTQYLSHQRRRI